MRLLEDYLRAVATIRGVGVQETSFYGALENLLNGVGRTLKPRVHCIIHPQNKGAGIPDGGLFTPDQLRRDDRSRFPSPLPARGAIEVKPPSESIDVIADSQQVAKYLGRYRQVVVTNLREFLLVTADAQGKATPRERYSLASSDTGFWLAAGQAEETAAEHGERFVAFLTRMLLYAAPLREPRDVAAFLAAYARDARARVEARDVPALLTLREALEAALGVHFSGQQGDRFFRSTLVQTLFYGLFSAWVLWRKRQPADTSESFDWRAAAYELHVPMISALFEQLALPSRLRPLGLMEVLEWTADALNRVEAEHFFARFEEGGAVQYFYEPFLEAFDPRLRRELGVWYTPPEIVRYQVARIDRALREELGIADGFADENVYVLDPCCGTGAYLTEVLRHIAATLRERGEDALLGYDIKQAALKRVVGFELLPAPFVVAHLQLGLLFQNLGAPLSDERNERAAVYLTNALTGWSAAEQQPLPIPELAQERDAARAVKREAPILVILGNPPYNGYAGVAMDEERDLSTAYRATRQAPPPQGQGLNDLYIRFFRMAERRIVEGAGRGIVCFISNYSWLDGLSFTGMRERYLEVFDRVWIDSLNGDKYRTGKLTPTGEPDPSVFSTEFNREGIQVGTAIALLVRTGARRGVESIFFRNVWGRTKRADLLATSQRDDSDLYTEITPPLALGLPFMPAVTAGNYLSWPLLPDLFPTSFPGVKTSRDDVLVDIDRERLVRRMEQYFDPSISHERARRLLPGLMSSGPGFNAEEIRNHLLKRGFLRENIIRYCYRPFDIRWLYWEPETKLLDRNRTEYFPHVFPGNYWIEARQKQPMERFDRGYLVRVLADNFGNGLSSFFPLYLAANVRQRSLFDTVAQDQPQPNLSGEALAYLERAGASEHDLFFHALAILHSPVYRAENAGALRQNWPRIPLPLAADTLRALAALGRQVAALLDPEEPVAGVTTGTARPALRHIGPLTQTPAAHGMPVDLTVAAGWGHAGQGGVVMPGRGRVVERGFTGDELAALDAGAAALGLVPDDVRRLLGPGTVDVYLNGTTYWRNVPAAVWEYTIGGYQVIKKWLSYREAPLLGRPLNREEAREVMNMARRIAAIVLLQPALDTNYQAIKLAAYTWPAASLPSSPSSPSLF